jgi:transcriptional regulator with XRE-family HTH domain
MDFSERLEALMESHKVTIGHLSKETGISKSSLHGYLQGAEASMGNAVKLADYFDVSLDFLIVGKKNSMSEELMRFAIHDGLYEVTVKKKISKEKK